MKPKSSSVLGVGIPLFGLIWPLTDHGSYKYPWLPNGREVVTWISPNSEGHSTGDLGLCSGNSFSGKLSGWVHCSLMSSGAFIFFLYKVKKKKRPQVLTTGCYFIKEHTQTHTVVFAGEMLGCSSSDRQPIGIKAAWEETTCFPEEPIESVQSLFLGIWKPWTIMPKPHGCWLQWSQRVWKCLIQDKAQLSIDLCFVFLKIHWVYLHVAIKLNFIFCRGLHSSFY